MTVIALINFIQKSPNFMQSFRGAGTCVLSIDVDMEMVMNNCYRKSDCLFRNSIWIECWENGILHSSCISMEEILSESISNQESFCVI